MIDETTFLSEVEAHSLRLYRVARSLLRSDADCKDAYQEALLKAWQNRHKLRDSGRFAGWLTRILINECRNIQRRQWRLLPVAEPRGGVVDDVGYDPGVREAIEALPEKQRIAVVLHYLEGLPTQEVAAILGTSQGAIRTRLYKARERLRLDLGDYEEGEKS